jgi:hypothetical protein
MDRFEPNLIQIFRILRRRTLNCPFLYITRVTSEVLTILNRFWDTTSDILTDLIRLWGHIRSIGLHFWGNVKDLDRSIIFWSKGPVCWRVVCFTRAMPCNPASYTYTSVVRTLNRQETVCLQVELWTHTITCNWLLYIGWCIQLPDRHTATDLI